VKDGEKLKLKSSKINPKHKTTIGGQALIEGIMMRGPNDISIAIRKPNNDIELKVDKLNPIKNKYKFLGWPIIRGVVSLVESLSIGTKALMYSAEFYEEEEAESDKETFTQRVFKDKAQDVEMTLSVIISVVLAVGIFMILPSFITNFAKSKIENHILLNLVEGLIRIIIFFIYVIAISKMEDIKRVFEYHGAEHKTIHCYENEEELTVENVKKYSILHPRCGTSFLFMVMIISVIVLSFFGWPNPLKRVLIRVLMFPVIAGISYEVNRFIGRSNSSFCYYISLPGLMVQKIATVREPDDGQIEVAIKALEAVIPQNREDDKW
jgi:uncharacterized protein YqhQ